MVIFLFIEKSNEAKRLVVLVFASQIVLKDALGSHPSLAKVSMEQGSYIWELDRSAIFSYTGAG